MSVICYTLDLFPGFKKMSELDASVSCSPQCAETDKIKNTDDINPEKVQNTNTNISQVEEGESISWNP